MLPFTEQESIRYWVSKATPRIVNEGLWWYDTAHKIACGLAEDYHLPLWKAAAVLAVLSPACDWDKNVEDADALCKGWCAGDVDSVVVSAYNVQKYKAVRILEHNGHPHLTEKLQLIGTDGARKTRAFFLNIWQPGRGVDVTIDRWVSRAVTMQQNAIHPSKSTYHKVQAAFVDVARERGCLPCQVQAIVWLVIRGVGLAQREQNYLF